MPSILNLSMTIKEKGRMKIAFATLVLFFLTSYPAHAGCSKKQICGMLGKMTHFGILDKCPGSGSLLAECKKVKETTLRRSTSSRVLLIMEMGQ